MAPRTHASAPLSAARAASGMGRTRCGCRSAPVGVSVWATHAVAAVVARIVLPSLSLEPQASRALPVVIGRGLESCLIIIAERLLEYALVVGEQVLVQLLGLPQDPTLHRGERAE
jgi:hypothetical protein